MGRALVVLVQLLDPLGMWEGPSSAFHSIPTRSAHIMMACSPPAGQVRESTGDDGERGLDLPPVGRQ